MGQEVGTPIDVKSLRCTSPAVEGGLLSCRLIRPDGGRVVFDSIREAEFDEIMLLGDQIREPDRIRIRYEFLPLAQCIVTQITEFETGMPVIPPTFRIECKQDETRPAFREAEIQLEDRLQQFSAGIFPNDVVSRWTELSEQVTQVSRQELLDRLRDREGVDELEVELFEAFLFGHKNLTGLEAATTRAQEMLKGTD